MCSSLLFLLALFDAIYGNYFSFVARRIVTLATGLHISEWWHHCWDYQDYTHILLSVSPSRLRMTTIKVWFLKADCTTSHLTITGADPERGSRRRTPTLFCAKFFKKSPKLVKKILGASPRTPCAPSFSNPGSAPAWTCYAFLMCHKYHS